MRNKKNILKILIVTVILLFVLLTTTSQAAFWSDVFKYGDNFLETGASNKNSVDDFETKRIMNDLYSIVFTLGVAVTVIIGGVLGIKFMLASAEDKAKVKESMVPYIVGCVVIYGAVGIWKICIQLFSALS